MNKLSGFVLLFAILELVSVSYLTYAKTCDSTHTSADSNASESTTWGGENPWPSATNTDPCTCLILSAAMSTILIEWSHFIHRPSGSTKPLWIQPPLRRNSLLCSTHFLTGIGRYFYDILLLLVILLWYIEIIFLIMDFILCCSTKNLLSTKF